MKNGLRRDLRDVIAFCKKEIEMIESKTKVAP
jgi:hypothetical protein